MTPEEKEDDFKQSLFLLKTFYPRILGVCDTIANQYLIARDHAMDYYYTALVSLKNELLSQKRLKDLREKEPHLPESLIVEMEDFDIDWENDRKLAYNFLAEIEKLYIMSDSPVFDLQPKYKNLLQKTDSAIDNYKGYFNEEWQKELENTPSINSHNFPKDLKWEEITIRFLNGNEVIIETKDKSLHTTYEEMGFQDRRTKLPNKQWQFLKILSETESPGRIAWGNKQASLKGKKQKQLLAEALKKYFQIQGEPFYTYKKERTYEIKMKLMPENNQGKNMVKVTKDDTCLDIDEFYKEQTPGVYEE